MKKIFDKLQGLSEQRKKIILWLIVIITVVFLFKLYIQNVQNRIKNINGEKIKEELRISELQEELNKSLHKFEIPKK